MNGKYQVSNYGRVKSSSRITKVGIKNVKQIKRKDLVLKQQLSTKKYLQVRLYDKKGKGKTLKVHRLVAQAFIPNPNNLPQVNHIDGNKQNNNVNNLEWVSNYENIQHAIKNGLINQELRVENMRILGKSKKGLEIRWKKKLA